MKKKYIIPSTSIMQAEVEQILATSGVISNSNDINIGYGGIDEDGDLDPCAKENAFDLDWTDW